MRNMTKIGIEHASSKYIVTDKASICKLVDLIVNFKVWCPPSPVTGNLVTQRVKNLQAMQVTRFNSWVGKFSSKRDQFNSFSHSVMSNSLPPHESQHARPPCPSHTPRVYINSCPSSQWCHPTISSSVAPSPPAPNPSQHQGLFQWVNSSHDVAKVLEFQLQHQSFQWTPRTDLL